MTRRSVVTRTSSATTDTVSSCSCGKTSRNQPIDPARESTAPSRLTETLVTRPANNKVHPKARTNGQTVGAGTSISRGGCRLSLNFSLTSKVAMLLPSASQNIHNSENDDPNCIHKMPVHGEHFYVARVFTADPAG